MKKVALSTDNKNKVKEMLAKIMAKNTGQKLAKVKSDMERDYWMTPDEAVKYGLIDKVLTRLS